MTSTRADFRVFAFALAAIAAITALFVLVLHVTNVATVAVSLLLVVLLASANARLWVGATASVAAMLAFNFFFMPPVGTLTVSDPQNWVALFAFLGVGLAGSGVSAAIRARAALADEHARLVSERETAELTKQSEALKSALLASLAHDLKTPLTAIRVAAGNLDSHWLSDAERRDQRDIVLSEVTRLTRLFDNILDMARIEAGAVAATTEWVPAIELVEAARTNAEPDLRDHAVDVIDHSSGMVRVDPRLTSAALAHLLTNAGRYAPPHSPISVEISMAGNELTLSVRDRGPGIPATDLEAVFNRFYRGRAAPKPSGIGMGLAIARGLLAANGGRIWAENCPDGGARFTIALPAEHRPSVQSVS